MVNCPVTWHFGQRIELAPLILVRLTHSYRLSRLPNKISCETSTFTTPRQLQLLVGPPQGTQLYLTVAV